MIKKFSLFTVAAVSLLTSSTNVWAYTQTGPNSNSKTTVRELKTPSGSYSLRSHVDEDQNSYDNNHSYDSNQSSYDNMRGRSTYPKYSYKKTTIRNSSNRDMKDQHSYDSYNFSKDNNRYNPYNNRNRPSNLNNNYSTYHDDGQDLPHQLADVATDFHDKNKSSNLWPSDSWYVTASYSPSMLWSLSIDNASVIPTVITQRNNSTVTIPGAALPSTPYKMQQPAFNWVGGTLGAGYGWQEGLRVELEGVMLNNISFTTPEHYILNSKKGETVFAQSGQAVLTSDNKYKYSSIKGFNLWGPFLNVAYDIEPDTDSPVRVSVGGGVGYLWGSVINPGVVNDATVTKSFNSAALRGQVSVLFTGYPKKFVPFVKASVTKVFSKDIAPASLIATPDKMPATGTTTDPVSSVTRVADPNAATFKMSPTVASLEFGVKFPIQDFLNQNN